MRSSAILHPLSSILLHSALPIKVLDNGLISATIPGMTLTRLLFEPTLTRSPLRVVQWWESRRPAFNVLVGATGVGTILYANLLSFLVRGEAFIVPWQLIVAYGLAANVGFTFGWIAENLVERWLKRPVYGLGPALFRHGLVFAVGLTMIPAAMVTILAIGGTFFR